MALSVIGRLRAQREPVGAPTAPAMIMIDYPAEGSVFPPEITAPAFLWRGMTWNVRTGYMISAPWSVCTGGR